MVKPGEFLRSLDDDEGWPQAREDFVVEAKRKDGCPARAPGGSVDGYIGYSAAGILADPCSSVDADIAVALSHHRETVPRRRGGHGWASIRIHGG